MKNMQTFTKPYGLKWYNCFYEMKGDVGMSRHENERERENA